MDDLMMATENAEEYSGIVGIVFERPLKKELKLRLDECRFMA